MKRTLLALATTLAVLASADIASKDATAEAARIHEGALVLDTHLDTPANLRRPGWSIADDHRHEGEPLAIGAPARLIEQTEILFAQLPFVRTITVHDPDILDGLTAIDHST